MYSHDKNNMDIIEVFNSKLLEFVNDLSLVCPRVLSFKPLLTLALNVDKNAGIIIFDKYATKYEPYIMERNEHFFLNENYITSTSAKHDLIMEIKGVWATLSEENKETVWKYLHVLLLLYKKYRILNVN